MVIQGRTGFKANQLLWMIAGVASLSAIGLYAPSGRLMWIGFAVWKLLVLTIVSRSITGTGWGFMIDETNRISLSRFQTVVWLLMISSAYLAAAIGNVRDSSPDPLRIALPETVWLLMGISTTSLVGSPLLLSAKRSTLASAPTPSPGGSPFDPAAPVPSSPLSSLASVDPGLRQVSGLAAETLAKQGDDPRKMAVDGSVVIRDHPSNARLSDLFKGDMVSDVATIDLSKIQLFFFSVTLALSYSFDLGARFGTVERALRAPATRSVAATDKPGDPPPADPKRIDQFPPLDIGFVTMLGISNAGFLATKAVPRN